MEKGGGGVCGSATEAESAPGQPTTIQNGANLLCLHGHAIPSMSISKDKNRAMRASHYLRTALALRTRRSRRAGVKLALAFREKASVSATPDTARTCEHDVLDQRAPYRRRRARACAPGWPMMSARSSEAECVWWAGRPGVHSARASSNQRSRSSRTKRSGPFAPPIRIEGIWPPRGIVEPCS